MPPRSKTNLWAWIVLLGLIGGLLGFAAVETVTHHTGYDDRQRMLRKCQALGLDMVQDYQENYVCIRTVRP